MTVARFSNRGRLGHAACRPCEFMMPTSDMAQTNTTCRPRVPGHLKSRAGRRHATQPTAPTASRRRPKRNTVKAGSRPSLMRMYVEAQVQRIVRRKRAVASMANPAVGPPAPGARPAAGVEPGWVPTAVSTGAPRKLLWIDRNRPHHRSGHDRADEHGPRPRRVAAARAHGSGIRRAQYHSSPGRSSRVSARSWLRRARAAPPTAQLLISSQPCLPSASYLEHSPRSTPPYPYMYTYTMI